MTDAARTFPRFSPLTIIIAGCLISLFGFAIRSVMGFFQLPIITDYGWGRDTFGLAIAVQNLFWGLGQPFAGRLADRLGVVRVLAGGIVLYAAGLALMTISAGPGFFVITSGVIFGLALAGCSFNLVLAAFGKLLPPEWRGVAFGLGTAAGSFGQFLFSPLSVGLIDSFGWKTTLLIFAALILATLPLAMALRTAGSAGTAASDATPAPSLGEILAHALSHRSYNLLLVGFFTCGFHLAFITVHLPAHLKDNGLAPSIGGWVVAAIGLFNIVGALSAGWLCNRMPKRYMLAIIYAARSVVIALFFFLPVTPVTAVLFGVGMGLLWLSTVPPTMSLVTVMFGTRDMAMLYGIVFLSHQIGGFLGVWLAGLLYETTGAYTLVWLASIALGVISALINLPIVEKAAPPRGAAPVPA